MSRILLFLLFLPSFTIAGCPDGTITSSMDSTKCYLFQPKMQSFFIAEETCASKGGHLTSIHSAFENDVIREHAQINFTESTTSNFWIGLTDIFSTPGSWGWSDKSALNFVDWDPKGQPQSGANYDCGAAKLQGGTWISDNCDNEKPFVCLVNTVESPATTVPPSQCPEGWSYFDKTKSCYFVGRNKNWGDAQDYCVLQNAQLTSIHSLEENSFVANLIPFDPNDHACDEQQWAWIGLYTVTLEATWRWTDNSNFNFSAWGPGLPCCPNIAYCGILWNGPPCNAPLETWVDGQCKGIYGFFVCKQNAM